MILSSWSTKDKFCPSWTNKTFVHLGPSWFLPNKIFKSLLSPLILLFPPITFQNILKDYPTPISSHPAAPLPPLISPLKSLVFLPNWLLCCPFSSCLCAAPSKPHSFYDFYGVGPQLNINTTVMQCYFEWAIQEQLGKG